MEVVAYDSDDPTPGLSPTSRSSVIRVLTTWVEHKHLSLQYQDLYHSVWGTHTKYSSDYLQRIFVIKIIIIIVIIAIFRTIIIIINIIIIFTIIIGVYPEDLRKGRL